MPVEVVGLEIEQNGDVAGELVNVFELERGQLADDPVRLAHGGQRRADVSCDNHSHGGGAEDRAEQLRGGRLAVRARDADEPRAGQKPEPELDLGPHRDAAVVRRDHEGRFARDARAT